MSRCSEGLGTHVGGMSTQVRLVGPGVAPSPTAGGPTADDPGGQRRHRGHAGEDGEQELAGDRDDQHGTAQRDRRRHERRVRATRALGRVVRRLRDDQRWRVEGDDRPRPTADAPVDGFGDDGRVGETGLVGLVGRPVDVLDQQGAGAEAYVVADTAHRLSAGQLYHLRLTVGPQPQLGVERFERGVVAADVCAGGPPDQPAAGSDEAGGAGVGAGAPREPPLRLPASLWSGMVDVFGVHAPLWGADVAGSAWRPGAVSILDQSLTNP